MQEIVKAGALKKILRFPFVRMLVHMLAIWRQSACSERKKNFHLTKTPYIEYYQ